MKKSNVAGKIFSFAGRFKSIDSLDFNDILQPLGGDTRNHVSKHVDILVVGINPSNKQLTLAAEHQVEIWTESRFIAETEKSKTLLIEQYEESGSDIDWHQQLMAVSGQYITSTAFSDILPVTVDGSVQTHFIRDTSVEDFLKLDNLIVLESLVYDFLGTAIDEVEQFIAALPLLTALKALEINVDGVSINPSQILEAAPNLRCLIIRGNIDFHFIPVRHTKLKWLTLYDNLPSGLECLSLPNLTYLGLNNFRPDAIQPILNQRAFPKLTSLGIYSSRNKVAKKLLLLTLPPQITKLILIENKSGRSDLKKLIRHKQLGQIQHVHLDSLEMHWPSTLNAALSSLDTITIEGWVYISNAADEKAAEVRAFVAIIKSLPLSEGLTLRLADCGLDTDCLTALYKVLQDNPIKHLDISRNPSNNKRLQEKFDNLPFPVDYSNPGTR